MSKQIRFGGTSDCILPRESGGGQVQSLSRRVRARVLLDSLPQSVARMSESKIRERLSGFAAAVGNKFRVGLASLSPPYGVEATAFFFQNVLDGQ